MIIVRSPIGMMLYFTVVECVRGSYSLVGVVRSLGTSNRPWPRKAEDVDEVFPILPSFEP